MMTEMNSEVLKYVQAGHGWHISSKKRKEKAQLKKTRHLIYLTTNGRYDDGPGKARAQFNFRRRWVKNDQWKIWILLIFLKSLAKERISPDLYSFVVMVVLVLCGMVAQFWSCLKRGPLWWLGWENITWRTSDERLWNFTILVGKSWIVWMNSERFLEMIVQILTNETPWYKMYTLWLAFYLYD